MSRQPSTEALFSRESEHAIVAALFSSDATEAFNKISLTLTSDDFFLEEATLTFDAYADLVNRGSQIDAQLLAARIKGDARFTDNLVTRLQDAASVAYAIENIESYAAVVLEKSRARQLAKQLELIKEKLPLIGGELSSDEVLEQIESVAFESGRSQERNALLDSANEQLDGLVALLSRKSDGEQTGVNCGLSELDYRLNGADVGQLIVIAARPGMGKTVLGMQYANHHGLRGPRDEEGRAPLIAVFSLEMERDKLLLRSMSGIGSLDHERLRRGTLTDTDWPRLTQAFAEYQHTNIRIDDAPNLTPARLRAKLRILVQREKQPVSLIVIDYLQLMHGDRSYDGNRVLEVSEITRSLKKLAKEFGCPVIALSQLNRDLERRADKRPVLADLRESGSIEQDADVIIFIYRDEVYNRDSDDKGKAEIIVGKGREGGVGMVPALFEGRYQRFDNMPTGAYGYEGKYGNQ